MYNEWDKHVYTKERRFYGLPCTFTDKNELILNVPPNEELMKEIIQKKFCNTGIQCATGISLSIVNTDNVEFNHKGMRHSEGGWPKDVNSQDLEQTTRYKKKIERDENFGQQVLQLAKQMDHCALQNNAVNIYECYFENMAPFPAVEQYELKTISAYKDPSKESRPVTNLSWAPEGVTQICVSYCRRDFLAPQSMDLNAYIWDIKEANRPIQKLTAKSVPNCVEYNPKDTHLIAGGLYSGEIAIWDRRTGHNPTLYNERETSHRECINSLLWLSSKTNTEFFSGASDGQILTWDSRKISEPIDRLLMDPVKTDDQIISRAYGASVLEFETTIPTKFMVGTDQGMLFSCNRKGKTPIEKILYRTQSHHGPIYALERNSFFVKIFLTVGDWKAKIWSEECKDSDIIWTKNYTSKPLCGAWSKTRCSLYFIGREDGVLDAWDLLLDQHEPIVSMKLCDQPLTSLKVYEDGSYVAIGTLNGIMYLIELSDNMTINLKNDKALLTAMFERETKREKILESKLREMKLKAKQTKDAENEKMEEPGKKLSDIDAVQPEQIEIISERRDSDAENEEKGSQDAIDLTKIAEEEFFIMVENEKKKRQGLQTTGSNDKSNGGVKFLEKSTIIDDGNRNDGKDKESQLEKKL